MMPNQSSERQLSGYGLRALLGELVAQGMREQDVLRRADVRSVAGQLSHHQRLAILKAAKELSTDPLTAIKAGQRQRVHLWLCTRYQPYVRGCFRVRQAEFGIGGSGIADFIPAGGRHWHHAKP